MLASIVGGSFLYLAVFAQWESAMITIASVMIAVPIGILGGLMLGILAYRHPLFDRLLKPVLDLMQTIPTIDASTYVSIAMNWLVEDANFGLFTFTEMTRAFAWVIEQPYQLARALLAEGFVEGTGRRAVQLMPPFSWIGIIAGVVALGHYARDWVLASIVGGSFLYLAVFAQWESAMITIASVMIAVPIGILGGLMLGILAYRHPLFDRLLKPVLDLMQTIPIFAYLVPILFMFGFGPVSALVATVIYAMPPMVRITTMSLKTVDPEIVDPQFSGT